MQYTFTARPSALGVCQLAGGAYDFRVECATESAVGSDNDDADTFDLFADFQQRMGRAICTGCQITKHIIELAGVGAEPLDAFLRVAQLRRGHHVHGLGDLLGFLDASDLVLDVSQRSHSLPLGF